MTGTSPKIIEKIRAWARSLKSEIVVLAAAIQDPRTPLSAKIIGAFVVAYALSPIDLIPDFIPVVGLLDDLILVPLGLWVLKRMIPEEILAEHRARIANGARLAPNRSAAKIIIALWLISLVGVGYWAWDKAGRPWIF